MCFEYLIFFRENTYNSKEFINNLLFSSLIITFLNSGIYANKSHFSTK